MYCTQCGKELAETAIVCPNCGSPTKNFEKTNETKVVKDNYDKYGLKPVEKIFMIIATVAMGIAIIPLAWCIPMTIVYCEKIKNKEPISLAFKICTLIFVSRIAGILMLCADELE